MNSADRQRELQKNSELNAQQRAQQDAEHLYKPTRSAKAYAEQVIIGGSDPNAFLNQYSSMPVAWWDDMPYATTTTVGGIKVGANLTIDVNGILNASGGAGTTDWGLIGGDISDQLDLVTELGLKANITTPTFITNITTPYIIGNSVGNKLGIFTDDPDDDMHLRVDRNGATYFKVSNAIAAGSVNALAGIIVASRDSTGTLQAYPSDYTTATFQDRIGLTANSNCSNGLYLRTTANSPIDFYVTAAYVSPTMRLTGSGYLGINEAAPDERLEVNGNIHGTSNIYAEVDVLAYQASAPAPSFWTTMPAATNSTMGGFILWDTQFTMTAGVLKIKDSVLIPASHTHAWGDITSGIPLTFTPSAHVHAWTDITSATPTTLAGYGITDAMTTSHAAYGITGTNITNWNTAYSWGDHASGGYAQDDQTFYIGTTQVAINRGSGTLNLAGIGTLGCGAVTASGTITSTGDIIAYST